MLFVGKTPRRSLLKDIWSVCIFLFLETWLHNYVNISKFTIKFIIQWFRSCSNFFLCSKLFSIKSWRFLTRLPQNSYACGPISPFEKHPSKTPFAHFWKTNIPRAQHNIEPHHLLLTVHLSSHPKRRPPNYAKSSNPFWGKTRSTTASSAPQKFPPHLVQIYVHRVLETRICLNVIYALSWWGCRRLRGVYTHVTYANYSFCSRYAAPEAPDKDDHTSTVSTKNNNINMVFFFVYGWNSIGGTCLLVLRNFWIFMNLVLSIGWENFNSTR